MRFYVENFGCRATQADGAAVEGQLREAGWEAASGQEQAEVVVLNTCTVTAAADQDARASIRRIRRENPDCKIVVTGCYAQRAPEELAGLPGVELVIGNSHKHRLADIVVGRLRENWCATSPETGSSGGHSFVPISALQDSAGRASGVSSQAVRSPEGNPERLFVSDIFAHTQLLAAPVFDSAGDRTRPNLKVQDGCDNRCSFCVIPSVRGQSRSLLMEEVLREINVLVASGYREVVISGINLGRWGRDLDARRFRLDALIRYVLEHTAVEKLRISSVEPMDWSDELIALMAGSPRIAKHAHVPMQSGSDRVLRRMHRKYRPWHYREKIEKIYRAIPNAAIGADAMVGFPGESDAEFEETRRLVDELPFTYLHVFTYSPRPGTAAASLPKQVPVAIARERNRILRELAAQKKLTFMKSFLGRSLPAITLHVFDGEYTHALTDNYLKVRLRGQHDSNLWVTAWIEEVSAGAMTGAVR